MTTYKGIKGFNIPSVASDPSNLATGQIWYNTTSTTMKVYGTSVTAGAWSSGDTMNQVRYSAMGAGVSNTAALCFGGKYPSLSPNTLTVNESYNGTTWTEIADMTAKKESGGGFGTQTSAICLSGYPIPAVSCESWDGSSWTATNTNLTARGTYGKSGTSSTVGIIFGGASPPNFYDAKTETWNGTSWAETGNLTTGREQNAGAAQGTSTATLCFGGENPPYSGVTESWNGTSWTEEADLNTSRANLSGAGTSTDALAFGGWTTTAKGETESWNGTSWTEVADLGTAITGTSGTGTSASALNAAGQVPPGATYVDTSEEWAAGDATQTFTAS